MGIKCTLNSLPKTIKNSVVTIGNFDGVHQAHQALFKRVIERARDLGGISVVITFEPHPVKVMSPGKLKPLITILEQKEELVIEQGIDILLLIRFTMDFAALSAADFVKTILVDRLATKEIVVGYDYVFGHNREGNITVLREMGRQYDFTVHQVEPVYVEDALVSSTSIRNLIMQGDISKANRLIGRNYQIRGNVVRGESRGGVLLGYSTANLRQADGLLPREGVYIVNVELRGEIYEGLTNIGYNPTFQNDTLSIETHILDLSDNVLDERIRINFLSRLRDEIAFSSAEELSRQITQDIKQAREFFKKQKNNLPRNNPGSTICSPEF